jgi:hypothetical protein
MTRELDPLVLAAMQLHGHGRPPSVLPAFNRPFAPD